jgi:hypothetical protein
MGAALPRAHPEQEGCKMKGMNETREPDEQDRPARRRRGGKLKWHSS